MDESSEAVETTDLRRFNEGSADKLDGLAGATASRTANCRSLRGTPIVA